MQTTERRYRRVRVQPHTPRGTECVVISAWVLASSVHAASDESASDEGEDQNGSGPSSGANTANGPSKGAAALVDSLSRGDAVLIHHRPGNFWAKAAPCDNLPFILTKGDVANNNCAGHVFNGTAVSCTCLSGFVKKGEWVFKIENNGSSEGTPKKSVGAQSALPVNKVVPFLFVKPTTGLRLTVTRSNVIPITFTPDFLANGNVNPSALETRGGAPATGFTSVYLENIDMSELIKNAAFFRAGLTSLTLRNCSLVDGDSAAFKTIGSLQTINLENNRYTKIPSELLQLGGLTTINLGGNPISSVIINEREFQTILALKALTMDTTTASTAACNGGVVKPAQGINFCVIEGAASAQGQAATAAPATEESSSSSTNYLLIGVICGCAVIAVLLFLVVRKRNSRQKEEAFIKDTSTLSLLDETMSYDNSNESSMTTALLNDPIIITHRLPYNDVKVATCISRGGFGLVYSGTFNRRRVAIKKIRPELSGEIKHIESFLKEICLMASLSHPRIVEFVGVSWDSLRNLSAVTEFMERGDLRDVLHGAKERNVRLSWESHKARIAMHVAEALTYLHSLSPKVIHRDLKSKNVLLDNEMTAKLSDFGVSRERRFEESHMTAGIGTAFWIAPEVLLGMDYDERADIFSFGVVLSELDTDDYPYWNEKNGSEERGKQQENVILRMVATGALRPEFSASCPESVLRLAGACLDVDPEKRPSAAQIVYALQQLIKGSPLSPQSVVSSDY